jgi:2-polyprenyl-3-methyl-5-hydroxy-6-metoxy-1,4-benzoquinol methylase
MLCRHCKTQLKHSVVDLGTSPPSNAYLRAEDLDKPEKYFPLRVLVCDQCWLVQTEDFANAEELFDRDYAYFSGFSTSWLEHSQRYVATMVERFKLHQNSHVVEVAANDGYLLQYVVQKGIPCTGIEPTASTAEAARQKGISIVQEFFGVALAQRLASQGLSADLMAANNVLAHVPDINDFVAGFAHLLKPTGVATFEFPHLLKLIAENQFDTIYHEHFSYLSLTAVAKIFEANGLTIFDVQQVSTHGGSLRVFAQRSDSLPQAISGSVKQLLDEEQNAGVSSVEYYQQLQANSKRIKDALLKVLIEASESGQRVVGYGAAAKGNTLLNFAGVRADLLPFVVDRNPAKQGKFLPGSRIPIVGEDELRKCKPDYVLILPWNLAAEVEQQLSYVRDWGAKFVRAVPELKVS